eukprot:s1150_g3.t2
MLLNLTAHVLGPVFLVLGCRVPSLTMAQLDAPDVEPFARELIELRRHLDAQFHRLSVQLADATIGRRMAEAEGQEAGLAPMDRIEEVRPRKRQVSLDHLEIERSAMDKAVPHELMVLDPREPPRQVGKVSSMEANVGQSLEDKVGRTASAAPNGEATTASLETALVDSQPSQVQPSQSRRTEVYRKRVSLAARHLAKARIEQNSADSTGKCRRIVKKITTATWFSYAIMSVILFNLIFLGIEVSVTTQMGNNDIPVVFAIVNATVVLIFMVEVCMNFVAFGCAEFCLGKDRGWNLFDVVVISTSTLEIAYDLYSQASLGHYSKPFTGG